MPDTTSTSPATITYTTNPLLSPSVIGAIATILTSIASAAGIHVLDDPLIQQQLIFVIGLIGTAVAHCIWPHNDGKLSFSAPLTTPAPQSIPEGASIVVVNPVKETSITPLNPPTQVVG